MDGYDAVTTRRAVRAFIDPPVPETVLERVLAAAAWAPSGSNIQPWHSYVVTGAPLAQLKKLVGERLAAGDPFDDGEYDMYPPELKSPYRERRHVFAEQRYGALGIGRTDLAARQRAAVGMPQWSDVGMYLQTVMLLLRAEGLHSCPQMAWARFHTAVAEVVSPPQGLMLFCGMSIGYEDAAANHPRTGRALLHETVTFVGDPVG